MNGKQVVPYLGEVKCFLLSLMLKDFRVLPRCPGKGWSLELLKQTTLVIYQRSLSVVSLKILCFTLSLLSLLKTSFFLSPIQDLSLPNGTPVDTSSPASSSSLLNRLQLDDDLDVETRDLFVTVDDPKKHVCTMETYITYRVTTKVQSSILFSNTSLFGEKL